MSSRPSRAWLFVLAGGGFAGTVDIGYAWLFWALKAGLGPQRIFQSVAAGLLGQAAFRGGSGTAVFGLAVHYGISATIATVYFLAAGRSPTLVRRPWALGMAYGVVVYLVMNLIVVPLSAAGPPNRDPLWVALSIAVHAVGVGVPSAMASRAALAKAAG